MGELANKIAANRLLRSLGDADLAAAAADFELVPLRRGRTLHEAGAPLERVVFPLLGAVSVTAVMGDGGSAEVALIAAEGCTAVGLPGINPLADFRHMVALEGEAAVIRAGALHALLARAPALAAAFHDHCAMLLADIMQTAACNALHDASQRCCRRLLRAHDAMHGGPIPVTHDQLAEALGVRRATVTEALGALQAAGVLETSRGRLRVLDRAGLEARACECYAAGHRRLAAAA